MSEFFANVWPFSLIINWWRSRDSGQQIALPAPLVVIPEFEIVVPKDLTQFYNPDFYATQACADQLMHRFGAQTMLRKVIMDGEDMLPGQWFLRFSDGVEVNAGQLAKFFFVYPEDKYPGIAVRYGINFIAVMRYEKEHGRT